MEKPFLRGQPLYGKTNMVSTLNAPDRDARTQWGRTIIGRNQGVKPNSEHQSAWVVTRTEKRVLWSKIYSSYGNRSQEKYRVSRPKTWSKPGANPIQQLGVNRQLTAIAWRKQPVLQTTWKPSTINWKKYHARKLNVIEWRNSSALIKTNKGNQLKVNPVK